MAEVVSVGILVADAMGTFRTRTGSHSSTGWSFT